MSDVDSGAAYMDETTVGIQPVTLPLQWLAGASADGKVPVELFVDLPNIERSFKKARCFDTDYGRLVFTVLCRFAERLRLQAAGEQHRVGTNDGAFCGPVS